MLVASTVDVMMIVVVVSCCSWVALGSIYSIVECSIVVLLGGGGDIGGGGEDGCDSGGI